MKAVPFLNTFFYLLTFLEDINLINNSVAIIRTTAIGSTIHTFCINAARIYATTETAATVSA